ncbi:MauE/DoxX family redox-associated membrane protein [Chitinophaga sp. NPDC101104]|uniref:MauE/DoxX family redox-associated membrane protein n=1 Tax=Chitinophaga sp. NPDC101104 TaxID=3390561 RepID=UPI003D04903F
MIKKGSWRIRIFNVVLEILITLLVILWFYTSISKLYEYNKFRTQLGQSPFIESIAGFVSYSLPISELLLGILLVFQRTRKIGLYGSFFLMLLFTGYIYIMLYYAYDLPCSCGGVLAKMNWDTHLYFNLIYTVIALVGILMWEHRYRPNLHQRYTI